MERYVMSCTRRSRSGQRQRSNGACLGSLAQRTAPSPGRSLGDDPAQGSGVLKERHEKAQKNNIYMGTRIRSGPEGAPSYRQQARVATQQAQVQVRDMSRHHTT